MSPIPLHAGPLRLILLPDEGSLRSIFAGEHEVLRGIAAPIRDAAWATLSPRISNLAVLQHQESFQVTFSARCQAHAVDFCWRGKISGTADGALRFEFDGEALTDFKRNRIGFCVLHGAEVSGTNVIVEHSDGRSEIGRFPERIQTGAPFSAIRALTHSVTRGLDAEVRLEGDTFEMEDQRNWTDASFKTYCTPLALPRPAEIRRGTRIRQSVTVTLRGQVTAPPNGFSWPWEDPSDVQIKVSEGRRKTLPALGTIWNSAEASDAVIAPLRTLGLSHLRCDLWLSELSYPDKLRAAVQAAAQLGIGLEFAVFVDDRTAAQLGQLRSVLNTLSPAVEIVRWLVYHETRDATSPECITAAREVFAGTRWVAPIGGGATDNFAELNYHPAVATVADFTTHACNPQVHAFDETSINETLAMQALTAANARQLSAGKPVTVSPITLTRRWRLNEAGAPSGLPAGLMPFQTDPRHGSEFNAAWTLGSISALALEGVASVTYFEAVGPNGLLSEDGSLRPVGRTLASVAPYRGAKVWDVHSSHPQQVVALALEHGPQRVLLLANLRATPQRVHVIGEWGAHKAELAAYGTMTMRCS